MSLALLVPAFLIGLGLLAVPILIHLRQRERRDPVRFPSLMFLRQLPHKTTERRRITQPLLLLLRALAVALVTLGFARPFVKRDDNRPLLASSRRAVVLVMDRSMSMGYQGNWTRAQDSARAALAGLSDGDQAALVAFDESAEVIVPLGADRSAVAGAVAALAPNGRATRYPPALRTGIDLAARVRGITPEIVFITDLQRNAVAGLETVEQPAGATIRVASVAPPLTNNRQVVDVVVDHRAEGRQARLTVTARAASRSSTLATTTANLVVAGRVVATAPVRIRPNAVQAIQFPSVVIPASEATATVALAPDDLPADDSLRFTLGAAAGARVVLLLPAGMANDESLFLERALAISRTPALQVVVRRGGVVPDVDLADARAVVVADVAGVTGKGVEALQRFLARGGGVVLFAGRRGVVTAPAAAWLPAAVGRVIDRSADRGGRFGQLDGDHGLFEPFRDALASDFGAARFFRYRDLTPDTASAVLGRFDDGRPALVERRRPGPGRMILVATSPDAVWSDLPLQPVFLPLVQRLVAHTAGIVETKRWFGTGEAGPLPAEPINLTIEQPAGQPIRIAKDSVRTVLLRDPGFYRVMADDNAAPLARFAVNTAPHESDLATVAPGEIMALLKRSNAGPSTAGPTLTVAEQERNQSWWIALLGLGVVLLAAEALYAGRLQRPTRVGGVR